MHLLRCCNVLSTKSQAQEQFQVLHQVGIHGQSSFKVREQSLRSELEGNPHRSRDAEFIERQTGQYRLLTRAKDFLRKQDVPGHVMQLQTIFDMKLKDF